MDGKVLLQMVLMKNFAKIILEIKHSVLTFGGKPNLWNFLPISGNLSATFRFVFDLALSIAL